MIYRQDTYNFILRATIPVVRQRKSMPMGMIESNLLWDVIWRAHRDVLAGQRNVAYYYSDDIKVQGNGNNRINGITVDLYNTLNRNEETIFFPRQIITDLYETYHPQGVLLGAIQKLVNMTFKYIHILKLFECQEQMINNIKYSIDDCDCPLDSYILSTLEENEITWTSLDSFEEYERLQGIIRNLTDDHLALKYDFLNYQDNII